jgi:putative transposase
MIVKRAYKYRIYPNRPQREMLEVHFGCARYVYNHYLRQRIDCYLIHKQGLTYVDNANDLVFLKKQNPWLASVNSQTLQASLKDLEVAYTSFFRGLTLFPQFKKKHQKQSFRVPQHFSIQNKTITIPKIGTIRAKIHRPVGDKLCNITISKNPTGRYYASVLCEVYLPEPQFEGNVIGIDLGIKDYLVDSNGKRVPNPKYLQKSLDKLRRLQQILSSKTRHSTRYNKLRLKIAKLYEKIQNQRNDFLHKLSFKLARENQVCCVETLSVKKMLAESNHTLARYITDAAWYQFLTFLSYKGKWYGCHINQIKQYFPSSKRHFECGHINENLTLADREWVCCGCNQVVDRDWNAAKNILAVGITV